MTRIAGKRNRSPRVRWRARGRWILSPRQRNLRRDDGKGKLTVVDVAIAHILHQALSRAANPCVLPRAARHDRAPGGRSQVAPGPRGGGRPSAWVSWVRVPSLGPLGGLNACYAQTR